MSSTIASGQESPSLARRQPPPELQLPDLLTSSPESLKHQKNDLPPAPLLSFINPGTRSAPGSAYSSPTVSPIRPIGASFSNSQGSLIYGFNDNCKSMEYLSKSRRDSFSKNAASQPVKADREPAPPFVIQPEQTPPLSPTGTIAPTERGRPQFVKAPTDQASSDKENLNSREPRERDSAAARAETLSPERPSLLRKKSGELVKSSLKLPPLVRTRSVPNTKNVHFDANLVHVRRFNRKERPDAVAVGLEWASDDDGDASDDEDDTWSMTTPSFSGASYDAMEGSQRPIVYLQNLYLSPDKRQLRGNILVRNISFSKHVAVRYTVDFWKNVGEIEANYTSDIRKRDANAGFDRFSFAIPFADIADSRRMSSMSMFLAVRYRVDKAEHWDNNHSLNYELLFRKGNSGRWLYMPEYGSSGDGAGSPKRGTRTTRSFSVDRVQTTDDNLVIGDDWNLSDDFPRTPSEIFASVAAETQGIKPKMAPKQTNTLKSRYSFGAAYSSPQKVSATSRAASPLGSRPGNTSDVPTERVFPRNNGSQVIESSSYQDLISKYCFFNPLQPGSARTSEAGVQSRQTSPPQGYPQKQLSPPAYEDQIEHAEQDLSTLRLGSRVDVM